MPPWSELGPDELTALPSLMRMDYSLDSCPSTAALFLRRSSTTGPRAHPERLHGGTDGRWGWHHHSSCQRSTGGNRVPQDEPSDGTRSVDPPPGQLPTVGAVSYTHLRAHETVL